MLQIETRHLSNDYILKGVVNGNQLEGSIYTPEGGLINGSYGYYISEAQAELWLLLNN